MKKAEPSRNLERLRAMSQGTVPLSTQMGITSPSFLAKIAAEATEEHFGILRGAEGLATLLELRGRGPLSKESRKKLEEFVEDKARSALARLRKWLGLNLKRGRPRDFSKRAVWAVGAALREAKPEKYSWPGLTRKLDRKGYDEDPRKATDRMRQGILGLEREARTVRQGKGHP